MVHAAGTALHNDHLDVEIDPVRGTYSIATRDGVIIFTGMQDAFAGRIKSLEGFKRASNQGP